MKKDNLLVPKTKCRDCKWCNENGCWFLSDDPLVTTKVKPKHGCNQGRDKESTLLNINKEGGPIVVKSDDQFSLVMPMRK